VRDVLAIVTARGGSSRITRKSIAPLAGRPLMAWVLQAIRRSTLVTRTIVDTDDPEMAEVGRTHGAEVPYLRPAVLASPGASHVAVLSHALEWLRGAEGYEPEAVALVQPTNPFVTGGHLDAAVGLLLESGADSVETVIEVPTVFHPYNVRVRESDGTTRFLMPVERAAAARDGHRPPLYAIGNVYVFRSANLEVTGTIQGRVSRSIVIDRKAGFDVDEPFDLRVAEALAGDEDLA
jgi:CMP-N,N'-diacetyllegionaminic acid synthase